MSNSRPTEIELVVFQYSSGVLKHPRDHQVSQHVVSVVLIFASLLPLSLIKIFVDHNVSWVS